ncbi:MAG: carboxylesterase family protein [Caldilineaceae bacterium]
MKEQHTLPRVTVAEGILEGSIEQGIGVRSFKGIPFAQPPVDNLRWCPPQPPSTWTGIRSARQFGPRAMQLPIFGDMNFRSNGMSEDCLYLNIWTPAEPSEERLPVLVYFYGGGNVAGDGSEPRYDGERLAQRGIITVTTNYRLNVFGFFAHPELTQESPQHASGNYGYLDQTAALRWIQENIAAFGGDPGRITIAGESAGSISVSAQMISPLAKHLIAGAIGSSGSVLGALSPLPLAVAEQIGLEIAKDAGATSLAELRSLPAEQLLQATSTRTPQHFPGTIDGYFLPSAPIDLYAAGAQSQVPLLVGWNSEEMNYRFLLGDNPPTLANYHAMVRERFGEAAEPLLQLYPATNEDEVIASATDLAGDLFIGYSTWKWADLHGQSSHHPVYRYLYAHPRPPMRPEMGNAVAGLAGGVIRGEEDTAQPIPQARGAVHSADIEYFMGNLATNTVYEWSAQDQQLSDLMQQCYVNFVRNGDPNGGDVPAWPAANAGESTHYICLDVESASQPELRQARYQFLNELIGSRLPR